MTARLSAISQKGIIVLSSFYASARSYAEFECGGRTLMAVKSVKQQVITLDSDPAWLSKVEAAGAAEGTYCARKPVSSTSGQPESLDIPPMKTVVNPSELSAE